MKSTAWTKDQRAQAKLDGNVLFRASIDGSTKKDCVTGKYDVFGPMPEDIARLAFFFCSALSNGAYPQQAFRCGLRAMNRKRRRRKGEGDDQRKR